MKCQHMIKRKNKHGQIVDVPCGQCMPCRINKAREWAFRVMVEAKNYDDMCFLTLTYDDEFLPEAGSLNKKHLQDFMKRLRKCLEPKKIRFFACGEYGDTSNRPHYHLIVFNLSMTDEVFVVISRSKKGIRAILKEWSYGHVFVGNVTEASVEYVARYTEKKLFGEYSKQYYLDNGVIPEFMVCSNRPGIGHCFLEDSFLREQAMQNGFVWYKGQKMSIPAYFKNKGVQPSYRRAYFEKIKALKNKKLDEKMKFHKEMHEAFEKWVEEHPVCSFEELRKKGIEFLSTFSGAHGRVETAEQAKAYDENIARKMKKGSRKKC